MDNSASNLETLLPDMSVDILAGSKVESVFVVFKDMAKQSVRPDYSSVTSHILREEDEEVHEILELNLNTILEFTQKINKDNELKDLEEYITRILDHIKLARQQKEFIERSVTKAEDKIRSLQQQNAKLTLEMATNQISAKEVKEELNEIKGIKSRIYTEFVAILGIFTGIVIGFIGNFQTIGNVFTNINKVSTGKLLTFASLTALAFIVVLFLLMKWVSSIVTRTFNETNKIRSITEIMKDNAIFIISAMILSYTFILGSLMYYDGLQNLFKVMLENEIFVLALLVGLAGLIITVSYWLLTNKEKSSTKTSN